MAAPGQPPAHEERRALRAPVSECLHCAAHLSALRSSHSARTTSEAVGTPEAGACAGALDRVLQLPGAEQAAAVEPRPQVPGIRLS